MRLRGRTRLLAGVLVCALLGACANAPTKPEAAKPARVSHAQVSRSPSVVAEPAKPVSSAQAPGVSSATPTRSTAAPTPVVLNPEPAPRHESDRYPDADVDVSDLAEPIPQIEPRSRFGNRSPYSVLGKTYHVMPSADGYSEEGLASWYGVKFHGRYTSMRETYDMYAFTAAHKTLPLPSYVRVTNLDNAQSVVVRVNDRGPFHERRIIDLSYAAAARLGILARGTGRVRVETLSGPDDQAIASQTPMPSTPKPSVVHSDVQATETVSGLLVQIGSFADKDNAKRLRKRAKALDIGRVFIDEWSKPGRNFFRVQVGPFESMASAQRALQMLNQIGVRGVIRNVE